MNDFLGVGFIISAVLFFLCVGPFLLVWSINSFAELGKADFYIEHSIFSYFVSFVFLVLVRGDSSNGS